MFRECFFKARGICKCKLNRCKDYSPVNSQEGRYLNEHYDADVEIALALAKRETMDTWRQALRIRQRARGEV